MGSVLLGRRRGHEVTARMAAQIIERLAGLPDEPRPGAPRKISDADVERVLTLTLEKRPPDATHWSTPSVARRCALSHNAVSRIGRTRYTKRR
jgi:transposase